MTDYKRLLDNSGVGDYSRGGKYYDQVKAAVEGAVRGDVIWAAIAGHALGVIEGKRIERKKKAAEA